MKKADYLAEIVKKLRILAVVLPLLATFVISQPVLAAPLITLSPQSGAAGTEVTVTGTNFESYRGDTISVFFDNAEIHGSPLTVPDDGNFTFTFNIPDDSSSGAHEMRVRSEIGSTLGEIVSFTVPKATIKLDKTVGPIGSVVTIGGDGFYSNRTVTFYYFNRTQTKLGTEMASPTGDFSYLFTVPEGVAGIHRITAENDKGNSVEAEFAVIPAITLNKTSGEPGAVIDISGTGFSYKSEVAIYFKNEEVVYTNTDQYGTFESKFQVPDIKAGTYEVKTVDESNNMDQAKFTVTAGARISKSVGAIGSELIVSGSGFKVNGTVGIQYDGDPVAAVTADNTGEFTGTFFIPLSPSGKHTVTVTDEVITRQLIFTVESSPPPVPSLLLPAGNSETKPWAYFDWRESADPSQPVTYRFQIATDQNFASLLLEKQGITASEYTLPEEEKLATVTEENPYYWRVKAIDSATNESEWSPPWSFYVAPPPQPGPLLPVADTKAKSLAVFDWEDTLDLNPPIIYDFQLSSDPDFKSILLEKEGLTQSEYSLLEEEKLAAVKKDAPYYWRVKAIDSTARESNWSTPQSFYVGFSFGLSSWAIYTLIIVGIIIIGFLAFWLGRRTAYGQRPPYN